MVVFSSYPATSLAFQFPDKITDKTVIQSVPKFCFPEGPDVEKDVEIEKTESFSFVSTLSDGSKRFGYCRRFFKPNKPPECFCLISYSYVLHSHSERLFLSLFCHSPHFLTCTPLGLILVPRSASSPKYSTLSNSNLWKAIKACTNFCILF